MDAEWTIQAAPQGEPFTLDQAKRAARVEVNDEDAEIQGWIKAARQDAEEYLHRGLLTQDWRLTIEDWADRIVLPLAAPLQSVLSVKYYDTAGVQQTLSTSVYVVDLDAEPGAVNLAPASVWPALQAQRARPIEINYRIGWQNAAAMPEVIRSGIAIMISARSARLTGSDWKDARDAAESCWSPWRIWAPPVGACQ